MASSLSLVARAESLIGSKNVPAAMTTAKSYRQHIPPMMKVVDEERITKKARMGKMDMFTINKVNRLGLFNILLFDEMIRNVH